MPTFNTESEYHAAWSALVGGFLALLTSAVALLDTSLKGRHAAALVGFAVLLGASVAVLTFRYSTAGFVLSVLAGAGAGWCALFIHPVAKMWAERRARTLFDELDKRLPGGKDHEPPATG